MSTNHNIHSFLKKHGIKNTIIRYDLSREELQKICLERELGIESDNRVYWKIAKRQVHSKR